LIQELGQEGKAVKVPREIEEIANAILRSKVGIAGLTILVVMVALSIIALIYVPFNVAK